MISCFFAAFCCTWFFPKTRRNAPSPVQCPVRTCPFGVSFTPCSVAGLACSALLHRFGLSPGCSLRLLIWYLHQELQKFLGPYPHSNHDGIQTCSPRVWNFSYDRCPRLSTQFRHTLNFFFRFHFAFAFLQHFFYLSSC